MAYYVVCRSQYSGISLQEVMRCILEGFDWLKIKIPCGELKGRGGISRARSRFGYKVMQYLFELEQVDIICRCRKELLDLSGIIAGNFD